MFYIWPVQILIDLIIDYQFQLSVWALFGLRARTDWFEPLLVTGEGMPVHTTTAKERGIAEKERGIAEKERPSCGKTLVSTKIFL